MFTIEIPGRDPPDDQSDINYQKILNNKYLIKKRLTKMEYML